MTDERLKKIKDSLFLQLEVAEAIGLDTFLEEEKELYEYVEELKEQLKIKDEGFKAVNEELKEYAEENESLKKQLDYLRSGEYYNQLRFENEMLQQVVDTNGVPSEVYDFIDCTHRNTELLKQQQEFIKYLEEKIKYFKDLEQFAIKTFNNKAVINLDLVKISMDEDRIVIENLEEILQKYKEIIGGKE